jgi:hypothetical protein
MERRAEGRKTGEISGPPWRYAEHGVLATSHKDIASRADVSVSTVLPERRPSSHAARTSARLYRFRPGRCQSARSAQPPHRVARSRCRRCLRTHAVARKTRSERHAVPALDKGIAMREEAIRNLIRRALGRSPSAKKVRIVESILDTAVVNHLLDFGMDQDEVASTLASIINTWLEGGHA